MVKNSRWCGRILKALLFTVILAGCSRATSVVIEKRKVFTFPDEIVGTRFIGKIKARYYFYSPELLKVYVLDSTGRVEATISFPSGNAPEEIKPRFNYMNLTKDLFIIASQFQKKVVLYSHMGEFLSFIPTKGMPLIPGIINGNIYCIERSGNQYFLRAYHDGEMVKEKKIEFYLPDKGYEGGVMLLSLYLTSDGIYIPESFILGVKFYDVKRNEITELFKKKGYMKKPEVQVQGNAKSIIHLSAVTGIVAFNDYILMVLEGSKQGNLLLLFDRHGNKLYEQYCQDKHFQIGVEINGDKVYGVCDNTVYRFFIK